MNKVMAGACAALSVMAMAPAASEAANVLLTDILAISVTGTPGVLRAGSVWDPAPAYVAETTLFDNVFLAANTTWTHGTFWWDEAAFSRTSNPVNIEVQLVAPRTLRRFVVQADDNDQYVVDWWDGTAWQVAYTAPAVFTFGMETRDSGVIAAITTDRLRIRGQAGDAYYSLSEVQAFDIPEPLSMLLAATGLAAIGCSRRRRI